MKTIAIIALVALALVVVRYAFRAFQALVIGHYQYAIGLVENYLGGCNEDPEFVAEYDKYLSRKDPISKWMIDLHDMRKVRECGGIE